MFAVCANMVVFTEFVQISNQEIQRHFYQIYTSCSNIIPVLFQTIPNGSISLLSSFCVVVLEFSFWLFQGENKRAWGSVGGGKK